MSTPTAAPAAPAAPVVTPPPAAEAPAAPAAAPPAEPAAAPAGSEPAAASGAPEDQPGVQLPPWVKPRLGQLSREKHELNRRLQELEARINNGQPAGTPAPSGEPAAAPAAMNGHGGAPMNNDQVQQAAAQMLAVQTFNKNCTDLYNKGKEEVPGFEQSIENFKMLGGLEQHLPLVEAVTALPGGHKVLAHLGQNLEEAMRVTSLPPMQMVMEIARLEQKLGQAPAAPRPSNAPAPINPLTSVAAPAAPGPDDKGKFKDQVEYRAWRKAQRA